MQPQQPNQPAFFTRHASLCAGVLGCVLGVLGTAAFFIYTQTDDEPTIVQRRLNSSDYRFINPLLTCEVSEKKNVEEFSDLKKQVEEQINLSTAAQQATDVSVYFDMRDGRWLSINPNEKYFPASLMKVPLMIALYKQAQSAPDFLNKKILFYTTQDGNSIEYFKPNRTLTDGHTYTVYELIERMIVDSDNNAVQLLIGSLDQTLLAEVFSDLGIVIPPNAQISLADYMTVKSYASFFRVLYNGSYLWREQSEQALALLSQTKFNEGIVAGLPAGTQVVHKFGEREFTDQPSKTPTIKELHDCGIVYAKDQQYILCIMTKGTNFDTLAHVIANISKTVYNNVAELKTK